MRLNRTASVIALLATISGESAMAAPVELAPGISYDRQVRPGPQVIHVIRVRSGPFVRLEPILTSGTPATRAPLTAAVAARTDSGGVAAVNGDYFNLTRAYPSGIFATASELTSEPEPTRSALVVGGDGLFQALRLQLSGSYQLQNPTTTTPAPIRTFAGVNRPLERSSETVVYTPRFGGTTPGDGNRVEAVLAVDGGLALAANTPIMASVVSVGPTGGQTPIAPGQIILAAGGAQGGQLAVDLHPGDRVRLEAAVAGLAPGSWALGGGPALVAAGVPIASAGEGFTEGQVGGRTARTAIGQAGDGSTILVTTEGPQQGARGFSAAEQGELLAQLGAQTAVAMDSGGSAIMTLGDRLAIPWAAERPITSAFLVSYLGTRIEPLSLTRVSPNGDGTADVLPATVRSPSPGTLRVTIDRRGQGEVAVVADGPATLRVDPVIDPAVLELADGPYYVHSTLTPSDGTAPSEARQPFIVDRTLGGLKLKTVAQKKGSRVEAQFTLVRQANVTLRVLDENGGLLRIPVASRHLRAGVQRLSWDGTLRRKPAIGRFRLEVEARTSLGRTKLDAPVTITRRPTAPKLAELRNRRP